MPASGSRTPKRALPLAGKEAQFAFVRSLERGLAVIKSFGDIRPRQTIADVAEQIGVDRATARRFLLTLCRLGYVTQEGRFFRLSPQTLQLGYAYLSSLPWWRSAQREAERLRDRVGQNCAIGVLDRYEVVYVAYASAAVYPLMNRTVGIHLPALSTAIGRILIAHLEDARAREFFANVELTRLTPFTVVDRDALNQVLFQIRQRDFAYVDQELEVGLKSIGVPIRNRGKDVVAALSISFVGAVSAEDVEAKYLPELRAASIAITQTLAS